MWVAAVAQLVAQEGGCCEQAASALDCLKNAPVLLPGQEDLVRVHPDGVAGQAPLVPFLSPQGPVVAEYLQQE